MSRPRPLSRRFLVALAAAVAGMAALPFALRHSGLVLNYSDSVRPILFARSANPGAHYIVFCAPSSADPAILRVGASELPNADCPGGYPALVKPFIEASPAHPLAFDPNGFTFDGRRLPHTSPKTLSRFGIALTHYPFGRYTCGIWPISTESADSYDARYFGPIPFRAIRYRVVAVIGGSDAHA